MRKRVYKGEVANGIEEEEEGETARADGCSRERRRGGTGKERRGVVTTVSFYTFQKSKAALK